MASIFHLFFSSGMLLTEKARSYSDIVPKDMIAMVKAYAAGDVETALEWHLKLFPLCRDMLGLATNPIPVKSAMQLLGMDTGELRLPMTPLNADQLESLRGTLTSYGLL